MKEKTRNTLIISKEAYFFLEDESRKQRGCKPLGDEQKERIYRRYVRKTPDGRMIVNDDSLGGGDGTYNGKWWSWSVDDLKRMLDEKGFSYEDGETEKYIPVYI